MRRGFTLIEIVVVLFFMVVAAAMALPRFTAFQRSEQARDAARRVAAMVREARILAIERQRPIAVVTDQQSRGIALRYDDTLLPPDTAFGNGATGGIGSSNPTMPGSRPGANPATTAGTADDVPPRPPLYLPEPLMVAIQVDEQTSSAAAASPTGDLTFMPDGRAPDADIAIQYAPNQAMLVSVRQQGTQVQISNGGGAATASPMGPMR